MYVVVNRKNKAQLLLQNYFPSREEAHEAASRQAYAYKVISEEDYEAAVRKAS